MQQSIFLQKFKKVCVLQRRVCNNFKRNYLENYNDSEHAVKTKNAPFFMIFPNISFFHMVVTYCTGPLNKNATIFLVYALVTFILHLLLTIYYMVFYFSSIASNLT